MKRFKSISTTVTMTTRQIGPADALLERMIRNRAERPMLEADEQALMNTTSMTAGAWKAPETASNK